MQLNSISFSNLIKCSSFAIFFPCGSAEHLMALYSRLLAALPHSAGGLDIIRAFYVTWFEQVFTVTDYSLWKAVPLQLSNFVATFTWSYMDMFVTLMSMALTQKFLQLNERLVTVSGKVRHCLGQSCTGVESLSCFPFSGNYPCLF